MRGLRGVNPSHPPPGTHHGQIVAGLAGNERRRPLGCGRLRKEAVKGVPEEPIGNSSGWIGAPWDRAAL